MYIGDFEKSLNSSRVYDMYQLEGGHQDPVSEAHFFRRFVGYRTIWDRTNFTNAGTAVQPNSTLLDCESSCYLEVRVTVECLFRT